VLARIVDEALLEDLGPGDVTTDSIVPGETLGTAEIRARESVVAAGAEAAALVFRRLDPGVLATGAEDGARIEPGGLVMEIKGRARALLTGERTALNLLGRLCGIATMTRRYVDAARAGASRPPEIADTRKTTPGLRLLEKGAVAAGGGVNHRFGLWDAVLIKDNHVDLAGGIREAIRRAREGAGARPIEVEVRSLAELSEALEARAEMVLLDNFTPEALSEAAGLARGRAKIEVSGGVTLEKIPAIAALGVDRISVGALTHSVACADLTMRITTWKR